MWGWGVRLPVFAYACYDRRVPGYDWDNPPPLEVTHNWPYYSPPRLRRPALQFSPPPDPIIAQAFPDLALRYSGPFPVCGANRSRRLSADPTFQDRTRPCQRPAGDGTAHLGFGPCVGHTGNTSAVRKKYALEAGKHFITRFKAEQMIFGGDPDTISMTPPEALMEELRRSVAMVRFLQFHIAQWEPSAGDLGGLPALVDETTRGQSAPTDAAEWLRLYRDERAHMTRVAKMSIDAGVSLAMVQIEQQKGVLIASAVREILDSLSLSPSQAALVPRVVPQILSRFVADPSAPQGYRGDGDPNEVLRGVVIE